MHSEIVMYSYCYNFQGEHATILNKATFMHSEIVMHSYCHNFQGEHATILNKATFMHSEIVMYSYCYSRYIYLLMELLTAFMWSNWMTRHVPINSLDTR